MRVVVYTARAAAVVNSLHSHAGSLRRCAAVVTRHFHHWRPLRQDRDRRRSQWTKAACGVDDIAIHHRQYRLDTFDFLFRYPEEVFAQYRQVSELALFDLAFLVLLVREPRAALGPEHQGGIAIQTGAVIVHLHPADGAA